MTPGDPRCPLCREHDAIPELNWRHHQLLRCRACGLTYAWPPEIPSGLYPEAYEEEGVYHEYVALASNARRDKIHLTWAMRSLLATVRPHGDLLDVGCATGSFLFAALQAGWRATGLEVSERAVALARDWTSATVHVGSIEEFRPQQQFDVVTAWEILEHVVDPVVFIDRAVRLLKPGGILALSVPNWSSPWMRRSPRAEHWPPYHLTFWNRHTLGRLLAMHLRDVTVREKPFAWTEEVGRLKWVYLPIALGRSAFLNQKGMHLFGLARTPSGATM
jgi:2-polyprenyl-3-methyl-5-hydroxy-6-metoxy-1,4-benzoquinol methylase